MKRRRHFPIIGVTVMSLLLTWASLTWYQSQLPTLNQRINVMSSPSTASSQLGYDHRLNHKIDGDNSSSEYTLVLPDWIKSYIQWHDHQLRFNASDYNFLVYSCTKQGGSCGGIGDRLNGMIQSFYMAMCNQRVFLIEYDTPYSLTTSLLPNYIHWNASHNIHPHQPPLNGVKRKQSHNGVVPLNFMDSRKIPSLLEPALLQERQHTRQARGWMVRTNLWMEQTMPTCSCLQTYIQRLQQQDKKQQRQRRRQQKQTRNKNDDPYQLLDADDLYRWAFHALFQISPHVMERTRQIQQRTGLLIRPVTAARAAADETKRGVQKTPTTMSSDAENNVTSTTTFALTTATTAATSSWVLQPYVAMHIRTGHGSTWSGDPLRHSGNQTFFKFLHCAKHLQQRLAVTRIQSTPAVTTTTTTNTNSDIRGSGERADSTKISSPSSPSSLPLPMIYVASDNVAIKQQFGEWDNKSTFRYDHALHVVHVDKTSDPPLESYLDVWAELVVLWQAKALVMSVSKFSQLAEILGRFNKDTARYFDQCEDDGDNGTRTSILQIQESTPPIHHNHRNQVDEAFIEKRKNTRL